VIIPFSVWEEITVQGAGMPGVRDAGQAGWLEIRHAEPVRMRSLSILVDRGEAEAIALAMDMPGSTVLLDDAQARRVAERFGVERIGTLGILRRAKKAGLIEALKPLIDLLQASGIYPRQTLVDTVLRDVGEQP
jgi:predicted nucleic acid-binding protein